MPAQARGLSGNLASGPHPIYADLAHCKRRATPEIQQP